MQMLKRDKKGTTFFKKNVFLCLAIEVQRYLMCKSVSSFVIAAPWRSSNIFGPHGASEFVVFCNHHRSSLVCSLFDPLQVFVMLALWWMQVPLTIALSSVLIAADLNDLSLCSASGAEVWGLVTFVTNFMPNLGTKGAWNVKM